MNNTIRSIMLELIHECVDSNTNEVNATRLAEMTCCELNDYIGDDIPEEYFELAAELANDYKTYSFMQKS